MPGVIREIELPMHADSSRGKTVSVDFDAAIPFPVKRMDYVWNVPSGVVRAARANTVEQSVFVCIRGRCNAKISTDGSEPHKVVMNSSNRGLFVDNLVWHEFTDFSPDAIVLCFSSTPFLPDNYITDFEEFQGVVQK